MRLSELLSRGHGLGLEGNQGPVHMRDLDRYTAIRLGNTEVAAIFETLPAGVWRFHRARDPSIYWACGSFSNSGSTFVGSPEADAGNRHRETVAFYAFIQSNVRDRVHPARLPCEEALCRPSDTTLDILRRKAGRRSLSEHGSRNLSDRPDCDRPIAKIVLRSPPPLCHTDSSRAYPRSWHLWAVGGTLMIIDHQGVAEAGELALRLRSLATITV